MLKITKKLLVLALALSGTSFAQAQQNVDVNSTYETMQIRPPRPGRVSYVTLGSARTQKILTQTFEFDAYQFRGRAWSLRLVGLVGTTSVHRVEVVLRNGERYTIPELSGSLRNRRVREAYLGGERIDHVIVTATSGNLTGSRAQFRVDLGLLNRR